MKRLNSQGAGVTRTLILGVGLAALPALALAQASPFETGANSAVTTFITLATPIATLAVMGLGVAAIAGRIAWGWVIGAVLGIAVIFGAGTLVTWVRGLFGV